MTEQDPHLWPADFLASIWDAGFDAALDAADVSAEPLLAEYIKSERRNPYVIGDKAA